MAKLTRRNPAAFVLQFIGSIIYLVVVYLVSIGTVAFGSAVSSIWLPLLYAGALISSILLFIVSFTNLMPSGKFGMYAGSAALIGGFTLMALTYVSSFWLFVSIVGFILAIIGAGLAKE
ncbi:hypothetical protein M1329_00925 [Candidatus Marsarchaeota archaeon]|nr:hypothetical protein [Candidatus Marsarchaeota archaeon]MCL5099927.1 hypothetical protein [Candidatus Marsarchaeota archaeon]